MPLITIGFGVLLMVISILTYVLAEGQEPGAFAPAVLGLLLVGCGVASIFKREYRKHIMHGAVLLAAIAVVYPLVVVIDFMYPPSVQNMTVTRNILVPLACGVYLYLAIQSFRNARKAGGDKSANPVDSTGGES